MKNYEEMAKDVLHRIGEYEEEKKNRRSHRAVAAGAAVSLCTVAVIGAGLWRSGAFAPENTKLAAEPGAEIVGTDVTLPAEGDELKAAVTTVTVPAASTEAVVLTDIQQEATDDNGSEVEGVCGNNYEEVKAPSDGTVTMQPEGSDEPVKGRIIYAYPTYTEASYRSPENGTFFLYREVQGALDEYGSDENIIYYVIIDVFSDGHQILDDPLAVYKAESDRLFALGYTSIIETYTDQNGISTTVLALHATADQLRNFVPAENYGYAIRMHDEWKPGMEQDVVSFNGTGKAVLGEAKEFSQFIDKDQRLEQRASDIDTAE